MKPISRLEGLKQELLALRERRRHIKEVPDPGVVGIFHKQKQLNKRRRAIQ